MGAADDLGNRLQQLGVLLACVALLLIMHDLVRSLKRRLAHEANHVVVRQFILAWPGALRCGLLEPRHVSRSFLRLDGKYCTVFHIGVGAKGHLTFVPALLRLVQVKVVRARSRLVRNLSLEFFALEPILRLSCLLILHVCTLG